MPAAPRNSSQKTPSLATVDPMPRTTALPPQLSGPYLTGTLPVNRYESPGSPTRLSPRKAPRPAPAPRSLAGGRLGAAPPSRGRPSGLQLPPAPAPPSVQPIVPAGKFEPPSVPMRMTDFLSAAPLAQSSHFRSSYSSDFVPYVTAGGPPSPKRPVSSRYAQLKHEFRADFERLAALAAYNPPPTLRPGAGGGLPPSATPIALHPSVLLDEAARPAPHYSSTYNESINTTGTALLSPRKSTSPAKEVRLPAAPAWGPARQSWSLLG